MARASVAVAASMSISVRGSGISSRKVGSRWRSTASSSTPRPARMRASRSPWPGELRDRQRPRLARRVEPRAPGAAGERGFDVEEEAGGRHLSPNAAQHWGLGNIRAPGSDARPPFRRRRKAELLCISRNGGRPILREPDVVSTRSSTRRAISGDDVIPSMQSPRRRG